MKKGRHPASFFGLGLVDKNATSSILVLILCFNAYIKKHILPSTQLELEFQQLYQIKYIQGYQYYAQKDYKNAIIYFEEALTVYPNYLKVKYRVSYAYIQLAGNERQWSKDVFWKAISHIKSAHEIYKNLSIDEQEKNRSTYIIKYRKIYFIILQSNSICAFI